MNISSLKELQQKYESKLQEKMAENFQLSKENVSVQWSLEKTIVTIVFTSNNNVTILELNYSPEADNLFMSSTSRIYHSDSAGNIIGVSAGSTTIDVRTLVVCMAIIKEVLNADGEEDTDNTSEAAEDIGEENVNS